MATQGDWVWYELVTPDPVAAAAFYGPLVGWKFRPGTAETNGYGFIGNADGGMTAGVLTLTDEMAAGGAVPGWLGYIEVDDCDAAIAAIAAAGGKSLMPATDVAMAGRIALVADGDGAAFYIIEPRPQPNAPPNTAFSPTLPGRGSWNELCAGDVDRALAMYPAMFGWALPPPMDMGEHGKYHFIEKDGVPLGAMLSAFPGMKPHWNHYFNVGSIAAAADMVRASGGEIVNGPHEVPGGGWILHGRDPQGGFFCLTGKQ